MSLLERLSGIGVDFNDPATAKMSISYFWSAMWELHKGGVTKAQIVSHFGLTAAEETSLDVLIAEYNGTPNNQKDTWMLHLFAVLLAAESDSPLHDTEAKVLARIQAF